MNAPQMLPVDLQETNERRYSPKHIDGYIRHHLETNATAKAVVNGSVLLLEQWLQQTHHPKKDARLEEVRNMDTRQLVMDILVRVSYYRQPELFTAITGQLAHTLGFDEKKEALQTVAEICGVICWGGGFNITKEDLQASMMICSNLALPQKLLDAIDRSHYLPPMVCAPQELTNNFQSGYLTHNDCLVLGKGNGHTGNICLDVINTQNQVELSLDTEFLSKVEEEPTFELDSMEKVQNWNTFKTQSYNVYHLLVSQGNRFWITNKVDKRGRLYSQGYHVNPQGTTFKKAMLELANKEVVEGVPT